MPETFLMIVLTLMSNGDLSAAFSSAPNETACGASQRIVGKILTKAGYKIVRIGCFRSSQTFSPYEHGVPDSAPRQTYFITVSGETATVMQKANLAACKDALDSGPKQTEASYCATATQTLSK